MGLLDYGSGNLHSAARALQLAGADVTVSARAADLAAQRALVVPGVGAFAACMEQLESTGALDLIAEWHLAGRPLLGICVGHQVMFQRGTEHGVHRSGLGLWPGVVEQVPADRLPHMGWNRVAAPASSALFEGLGGEWFYFVHSYAALVSPPDALVTTAEHDGVSFVAAVEKDNLTTTQFHPEKSGAAGARLLGNWLRSIG